ncbi:MAG TPA: hypothetical protein VFU31_24165 [Candidatus Binatia bacterium]|nr:hypothetical protein [Candidatus Binatia bacterium]
MSSASLLFAAQSPQSTPRCVSFTSSALAPHSSAGWQGPSRFGTREKPQFIVREEDAERAGEISAEFYPDKSQPPELAELMVGPTEEDEQSGRICDLARKLSYNEAQIRMKLGQWAANLVGLERELLNELDDLPEQPGMGGRRRKATRTQARGKETMNLQAIG